MIVLYILLAVVLVIFWLLLVRVKVGVFVAEETRVVVRYLFIRKVVFDSSAREPEPPSPKPAKEPKPTEEKPKQKKSVRAIVDLVRISVTSASAPVKYLLQHVALLNIRANLVIAKEDAAQTAVEFGKMSAFIGGVVTVLRSHIKVRFKSYQIRPNFDAKQDSYQISMDIAMRPIVAVKAAVQFGWRFFKKVKQEGKDLGKLLKMEGDNHE